MQYGYFDRKAREYVITRPDTPTPWINYIGSGKYGGIVTNTGGGYSFHRDPQNRRITRYRYNNLPMDRPGRYIYVRDRITGEYWNPGYQPVQRKLDAYRCRHGMGYTVIEGNTGELRPMLHTLCPMTGILRSGLYISEILATQRENSRFSVIPSSVSGTPLRISRMWTGSSR